jgi:hypothetical protein
MYLLLFLICFGPFGPFQNKLVAIDFVIISCCFVRCLLVVAFDLCLFMRI